MKKILFAAFVIGIMLVIPMAVASASGSGVVEDGQVEGTSIRYTVFEDGTLELISSEGIGDWSSNNRPPWYKYASTIRKVVFSRNISTVGSYAFADFTNLVEFESMNPLSFVGDYGFSNTPNLKMPMLFSSGNVTVGQYAFKNSGITGIKFLTDSWKVRLAEGSFEGCHNLEYIVVNYDGSFGSGWKNSFGDCSTLKYICIANYDYRNVPVNDKCISEIQSIFDKSINIYLMAEEPGSASFSNPYRALGYCGDSISWSYDGSFYNEGQLTLDGSGKMTNYPDAESVPWHTLPIRKIVIGSGITSIGDHAFQNLPVQCLYTGGVQEIGEEACAGCKSLWRIAPQNDYLDYRNGPPEGEYIWNLENLFTIDDNAFFGSAGRWSGFDSIVFSNRVGNIFSYAFCNLGDVDTVMFPRRVGILATQAFAGTNIGEVNFEGIESNYMNIIGGAPLEDYFGSAKVTFGGQGVEVPNAPEPRPDGSLSYNVITGYDPETFEDIPDMSYIVGLSAGAGLTVRDFMEGSIVAQGSELRVLDADGSSALMDDILVTGQRVSVLKDDEVLYEGEIVLKGDVLGTGVVNISQLVRLGAAVNGSQPLTGCYLLAGDWSDGHTIDITDLVIEARLLQGEFIAM